MNLYRLPGWLIAAVVAVVAVAVIAPQQLSVLAFKFAQVALAVLLSYIADRSLFANAPGVDLAMPRDVFSAARILARAIIALAVVLGLTLGI